MMKQPVEAMRLKEYSLKKLQMFDSLLVMANFKGHKGSVMLTVLQSWGRVRAESWENGRIVLSCNVSGRKS